MNKKVNTLLFLAAASLYNIIIMIVIIVVLLFVVSRILPQHVSPAAASSIFIFVFILGIAGSFFIYHKTVRYLSTKIDMDRYFHPLFGKGKKK